MTFVGFQNGRPITAPSDSHVAATIGGNTNALVGKLVGKGRVLAYGDEWVTYTSQWTGVGNPSANGSQLRRLSAAGQVPDGAVLVQHHPWSQPAANCFTIVGLPIIIWVP